MDFLKELLALAVLLLKVYNNLPVRHNGNKKSKKRKRKLR